MRAGVYSGIGKVECEDVPTPEVGEDDVLVKVKAAAICSTDLRIFKSGHFAIEKRQKRILGHEFCGVVHSVGKNVAHYMPEMKVSVASSVGCGVCRYCRMETFNMCATYSALGISMDGGFAEYFKVPRKALLQGNLIHYNRIIVTGTTGGSLAHHEFALSLIVDKRIDTKSIISRRFSIREIKQAFDYALSGQGLKAIFEFQ
jgi:threonine dehydrogenase-like Zn-dependent dehydrogenase